LGTQPSQLWRAPANGRVCARDRSRGNAECPPDRWDRLALFRGENSRELVQVRKRHLLRDLVAARCAATLAVVEAIFAQADIELALAKAAVLLAFAALFDLLTLVAAGFRLGCHNQTLAPKGRAGNVPLVTLRKALSAGPRKINKETLMVFQCATCALFPLLSPEPKAVFSTPVSLNVPRG
jgi:hypothetical protein